MSTDPAEEADSDSGDEGNARVPGAGDDGRENREHIATSGEPQRDALGNADGAS